MGGGRGVAVLLLGLAAAACAPGGGIVGSPSPPAAPTLSESVIQSGLVVPTDGAVSADGRLFVIERPGTIDIFESAAPSAKRTLSAQIPGIRAMGEAGLLGLALDPDFATNGQLYVCASRMDQGEWRNQVLRYQVGASGLALETVIVQSGIVAAGIHDACRLRFGPDRKLWIATGDAGVPAHAQEPASMNGKILRINADGSVPSDNPVLKGATHAGPVFALGLRNPGGIAFHPDTGACYVVDAGDQMHDEIDLVAPGANFGWPIVLGPGGTARGFTDPLWSSEAASLTVAGAAFVTGGAWGSWNGSLLVATLKGQNLRRFTVDATRAEQQEVVLDRKYGRLRGVFAGPGGSIFVTTSNGNGDRIIRLTSVH